MGIKRIVRRADECPITSFWNGVTLVAMRKLLIGSLLGVMLVLVMAAPALALRDPFDPVISQAELSGGTGDTSGDGTGTTDGDGTGTTDDGSQVSGGADVMANTGSETEPWLVAAYALIAIGAGAVVLSKLNSTQPA